MGLSVFGSSSDSKQYTTNNYDIDNWSVQQQAGRDAESTQVEMGDGSWMNQLDVEAGNGSTFDGSGINTVGQGNTLHMIDGSGVSGSNIGGHVIITDDGAFDLASEVTIGAIESNERVTQGALDMAEDVSLGAILSVERNSAMAISGMAEANARMQALAGDTLIAVRGQGRDTLDAIVNSTATTIGALANVNLQTADLLTENTKIIADNQTTTLNSALDAMGKSLRSDATETVNNIVKYGAGAASLWALLLLL